MKTLLTGGNGFVGSHILERLLAAGHSTRLLLRRTSDTRLIAPLLPRVEITYGSLDDAAALEAATRGTEAVIHCAGKTKALDPAEFTLANQAGARRMAAAANTCGDAMRHFILIGSQAAAGPAAADRPAREEDPPRPVSAYGRSKLLAEEEVRRGCRVPFTILRPSAVYGPGDLDWLVTFKAVGRHLLPLVKGGRMPLSLVCVRDLAEAVIACLGRPEAFGRTYFVAHPAPMTTRAFIEEIARQMRAWTIPLPMPTPLLRLACLAADLRAKATRRPQILNRQKMAEFVAPGWVCSVERIRRELGFEAPTALAAGIAETVSWYRANHWL